LKDTTDILLNAVHAKLNGNVSYSSENVPFYDEKKKIRDRDALYCLYSTQQEVPGELTQGFFINDSFLDIEICHKTGSEVSKSVLSNVANQIYQILFPEQDAVSLTSPSGFQIVEFDFIRSITRVFEISTTESILRKIITVKAKIVEQQ